MVLKKLGIKITKKKKEGSKLKKGELAMVLSGRVDRILAGERTLLNLLQRMSGIATATNRLAKKLPKSIKLLATRKTFWGELDKRAVSVGGGCTHRFNLSDAVLIKENHIKFIEDIEKSFQKACKSKLRFIEIELETLEQVKIFIKLYEMIILQPGSRIKSGMTKGEVVVMLDNFKPLDIKKAVKILSGINVLIEVSGGVNEGNIKKYTIKGVNAISSGAITNKAGALDLSLNMVQ